jgi:DNA-directed RNA polymerase specialized sigma24 family protein/CheY-like chemotaxis protein
MSRSQLVAEHLPLLRRYARALTGSQASGDAYVGAMLEALLQDQSLLDERLGARVGLFRLFTQIWNSVSINEEGEAVSASASERRLSNITPLARQAFLLLSLEGFSEEEVAFILDTNVEEIRTLTDTAGRELAAEIATDVLIIEDETFIAMDLESLVKNLGHNVIGVARTHADAIALAKTKKPGLILADIQLADGSSGLDAVNELLRTFEVPVVFITAYPERFLTGERPEPAFLISKPFQPAMVSAVASQALFFQRNSRSRNQRATASGPQRSSRHQTCPEPELRAFVYVAEGLTTVAKN